MKKQARPWRRGAKVLVIICSLFLLTYALIVMGSRALLDLEYFRIKKVLVSEGSADSFSYLKGRPIFGVDLYRESRSLTDRFPIYKKIRIIRILPDQLYLDFVKRKPMAYVKLYRNFYVDDEGVLLEVPPVAQDENLPVIEGLETKIFGARAGKRYRLPEFECAWQILKNASLVRLQKLPAISRIDALHLSGLSFFMPVDCKSESLWELEVKLGNAAIQEKMKMLQGFLTQLKEDLCSIKYIDLRFKEPVIKFKDKTTNAQ